MRNIVVFIFIVCFIGACKNQADSNTVNSFKKITIPKGINKTADISELSDKISFVKLETKPECLIGNISKIICHDGFYYILDNRYANSVFIFNKDGKYFNKIFNLGKGKGQYLKLQDFSIDKKNKIIYLYDIANRKVLSYDFKLNFLKSINTNIAALNFEYVNGYFYFYTNKMVTDKSKNYELIITNTSGQVKNRFFEFDEKYQFSFETKKPLIKLCDKLLFLTSFKNKIFLIENDKNKMSPLYNLVFENPIPFEYTKTPKIFSIQGALFSFVLGNYCETADHVYFSYFDNKKIKDVLIDKRSANFFIYHHITNKFFEQDFLPKPIGSDDENNFIYIINNISDWEPDYSQNTNFEKMNYSNIDSLIEKYKAKDNPVLMFIHLK